MSWKKYAAGASGGALGYIVGGVPGAYYGADMAYNTAKDFEKTYPMMTPPKTPRKRKAVVMPGPYTRKKQKKSRKLIAKKFRVGKVLKRMVKVAKKRRQRKGVNVAGAVGAIGGKFNLPTKAGIKGQKVISSFLKEGYHLTKEDHGTVTDSDCVYLQHSNFRPTEICKVLCGAIFRKLFRKAGIEIANLETELPLFSGEDSDGFRIEFTARNPIDGTTAVNNYDIINNKTFADIVTDNINNAASLGSHMENYLRNANFGEPYRIRLYQSDRNGLSTNWRIASELNLECEKVTIEMSSKVTIQNRTRASNAGATDYDADRIDAQPIKGYIYNFKNADPRLKASTQLPGGVPLNYDVYYNSGEYFVGIRTWGGSTVGANAKYLREPPQAKIWTNVDGVSKVYLEPGVMKNTFIHTRYENYLNTLLKKLRVAVYGTGDIFRGLGACKAQIVALEENLRTPSDNQIVCTYEVEFKCGAMMTTKKNKSLLLTDLQVPVGAIPQSVPPNPP